LELDDLDAAKDHLTSALEIDSKWAEGFALSGRLHEKKGELPVAEERLGKAVELDPEDASLKALLGLVRVKI
ncbi:MAG TPA: hypothetical protein DEF51_36770, partial [Myxococcales bacterium]|nr:hypothetical protein [Myxococcales bacterium]